MVGHGARFRHKMEQAVAALLSCRNVEEAARAAGIGRNTLKRWMSQPEFDAAYRETRSALLSQAVARLEGAADAAAKTVLKIMLSPNEPAGARLRAAEIVLEQAAKASSIEDLHARIADLERNAGLKKTSASSTGIMVLKAKPLPASSPPQVEIATQPDRAASDEGSEE